MYRVFKTPSGSRKIDVCRRRKSRGRVSREEVLWIVGVGHDGGLGWDNK